MRTVLLMLVPLGDLCAKAYEDCNGCWQWTGTIDDLGYGRVRRGKRQYRAHRLSYEGFIADIPDGLVIDHLCRNRSCINPWHMDPVPQGVNASRGNKARSRDRTHCKQGHELTPENTRDTGKRRICRECQRATSADYKKRTKEKHG